MENKIKVFIDYPVTAESKKEYKNLSMPQLIHDYLYSCPDFEIIYDVKAKIDVALVFSGGSQYTHLNDSSIKKNSIFKRIKRKLKIKTNSKINFERHNVRNLFYEKRIKKIKEDNPEIKIIHRLDGRYRLICKNYGFDKTVKWINKNSDFTIFQNEYNKKKYLEKCKTIFGLEPTLDVDLSKSMIIENFVDRAIFKSDGDKFDLEGRYKILHVAANGRTNKGLGTVLEYANLLKDNPEIQFYLVGRQPDDPIYGRDIKKFENVHYLGFTANREELAKHYRSCDIFLFPSIDDCSPNTVIEAMACGLPVLGENSSGFPELIVKENLNGGFFINHQNPIYPLKLLIDNLDFYKKSCSEIIKRYHSPEVSGKKYADVIKRVVGRI